MPEKTSSTSDILRGFVHTELVSLEEFCIIKRLVANVARVALLVDIDHVFSKTIALFHVFVTDGALELRIWLVIV